MRILKSEHKKVERVAFAVDGSHLFASSLHFGSLGYGVTGNGIDVFDLTGNADLVTRLLVGRDVSWFAPLPKNRLAVAHLTFKDNDAPADEATSVLDWRMNTEVRAKADGWKVQPRCAVSLDGNCLIAELNGLTQAPRVRGSSAFENGLGCWTVTDTGELCLNWSLNLGRERRIHAVAVAPDGQSFWTAEGARTTTPPHERIEFLPRNANTGTATHDPIVYPKQGIGGNLAISPNNQFAVVHDGAVLFVYTIADSTKKPKRLSNPAKRKHFGGFAIHPSGNWLAAAGLDGAVTVWDTATWKVTRSWEWGIGQARSICFSSDGNLAAIGTGDGRVALWDLDL